MEKMDDNRLWELCVKKVNNSLDLSDRKEFERIKDTEEAKRQLLLAEKIHYKSATSFLHERIDREKNWKYINNKIRFNSPARNLWVSLSGYAAVFIVALLIGVTVPKLSKTSFVDSTNKIELEWGQMSKMTLSDGTQVWLNAGTTFEYPSTFNGETRTVTLNGEAQFKVAHNSEVPFKVKTKTGVVIVHGTAFNVSDYNDDPDMTVTLIEGKVSVENTKGQYLAVLKPSDQLRITRDNGKASLKKVNTDYYTSWIEGKILLHKTKLSEMTILLKRWYNVDIELVGKDIGDLQISGTISKGKPLDLFLKILERMYDVKYEIIANNNRKDKVIISKTNCL
ncbi:MAG: FecR family protein [Mangrovibacterium sp.]